MKNTKGKEKTKYAKLINGIIAIFIVIPLLYLVYYINIEKAGASNNEKVINTAKSSPEDTSKLQLAVAAAKSTPSETNYISLSLEYYLAGKYTECVEAAKKALEYNPKSYAAYNNICSAYNQLGTWDKAIVAGKMALELLPGDERATNNLKISLDGKAKQDTLIADGITLVKSYPNETNYMSLGNIYYSAGKYEAAIKSYEKVIGLNAKNIIAYNNICSANNELGKWKEAAEACEKALKIDSTYSLSKNNLKIAKENLK